MKHLKNTFMTLLIIAVFLSSFYVKSDAAVPETEYEEYHDQIDFDNLNLLMTSETSIDAYADTDSGLFDYLDGRKNLKKLKKFLEQYPEKENILAENMLKGTVPVAMSYTTAPCKEVDGHYERIEKKKSSLASLISSFFTIAAAEDGVSKYGNFALSTIIFRGRYDESQGKYIYVTLTAGAWSDHSFIGGSNYPASNYDIVSQSLPANFYMHSNQALATFYTDGSEGEEGYEYTNEAGGKYFCVYKIKDDPFGPEQLDYFILGTDSYANASTSFRKAHSCYTHTWSTIEFDVSVEFDICNNYETKLTVTPSIGEDFWKLHNEVTFAE